MNTDNFYPYHDDIVLAYLMNKDGNVLQYANAVIEHLHSYIEKSEELQVFEKSDLAYQLTKIAPPLFSTVQEAHFYYVNHIIHALLKNALRSFENAIFTIRRAMAANAEAWQRGNPLSN